MPNFFYVLFEGVRLPGKTDDKGTQSEQYVIVAGHNGAAKITGVHPGEPGSAEDAAGKTYRPDAAGADDGFWWNIDEYMPGDRILNHVIWREPISDGQTHLVNFTWMDQNSSTFVEVEHVAAKVGDAVATAFPNIYTVGAALVLNAFAALFPTRDDEFLGQFSLSGSWAGGQLSLAGLPGARTVLVEPIGGPAGDGGAPGFRVRVGIPADGRETDTTVFLRCFVLDH